MLFTKELQNKIGDEAFEKLKEAIKGKDLYLLKPEEYTPAEKAAELRGEAKTLKEKNEKLTSDLEASTAKVVDLEKAKGDESKTLEEKLEALSTEIATLKTDGEAKDIALKKATVLGVLKDHLNGEKVNPKYLKHALAEFDVDKLTVDANGKIEGFSDLLKPVKENYPDFFGETKFVGEEINGSDPSKQNIKDLSKDNKEGLKQIFEQKPE